MGADDDARYMALASELARRASEGRPSRGPIVRGSRVIVDGRGPGVVVAVLEPRAVWAFGRPTRYRDAVVQLDTGGQVLIVTDELELE